MYQVQGRVLSQAFRSAHRGILCSGISIAILVFTPFAAPGAVKERSAPNAISPDGKYEVVEVGEDDPLIGMGYDVELRERGHKEVLVKCECGYGSLKVDEDFTVVLWKPDSAFVAIKVRDSKRDFVTTLFYLDGKQTREVRPDLDYFQNICGRLGTLGNDFRNTNITPTAWNGNDLTLKVEVPSLTEDIELAFEVTMSCYPPFSSRNSGDPEPHASVIKITGPVPDPPENQ